jgi:hypothetical protein
MPVIEPDRSHHQAGIAVIELCTDDSQISPFNVRRQIEELGEQREIGDPIFEP